MMFVCPAANHGAVSEWGNMVSGSVSSAPVPVELAVACPPPDDCGEAASAAVCVWHTPSVGAAARVNSTHIQIVFRQATFLKLLLYWSCPPEEGERHDLAKPNSTVGVGEDLGKFAKSVVSRRPAFESP